MQTRVKLRFPLASLAGAPGRAPDSAFFLSSLRLPFRIQLFPPFAPLAISRVPRTVFRSVNLKSFPHFNIQCGARDAPLSEARAKLAVMGLDLFVIRALARNIIRFESSPSAEAMKRWRWWCAAFWISSDVGDTVWTPCILPGEIARLRHWAQDICS